MSATEDSSKLYARQLSARLFLVLLSLLAMTSRARAEPDAEPSTRAAARQLGVEGIELFRQDSFAEALDRFHRAYALYPAPTLGVREARTLVKLGRWVEASERYRDVLNRPLEDGASAKLADAQAQARVELDELTPRIPQLVITLDGARGGGVTVHVDGTAISPELIGVPYPIDPGVHAIIVARAGQQQTSHARTAEGRTTHVRITVPSQPAQPAPIVSPPRPPRQLLPPVTPERDTPVLIPLGWVTFGVGVGGLVAFAINGGVALEQEGDLAQRCPGRVCPPDAHDQAETFNALRSASTVGLVIGGAGVALGITLLIVGHGAEREVTRRGIEPWVGLGAVGVRGSF